MKAVRFVFFALAVVYSVQDSQAVTDEIPNPWVIAEIAPPFIDENDKGKATGVAVELVHLILNASDIDSSVLIAPWPRIAAEAESKSNVLAFPIVRTEEREELFHWITPITRSRHQIFSLKPTQALINVNDLQPNVVTGVISKDYREAILVEAKKPFKSYETWLEAVEALIAGDVDYLFASQGALDFACAKFTESCPAFYAVYTHSETTAYLALSKKETSLAWAEILKNNAIKTKQSTEYQQRVDYWMDVLRNEHKITLHYANGAFNLWPAPLN